ncbi:MAG TPA: MFS transporter [Spirochaetota bacterium]|nr:MFS transporter [Spirochaetota bacterium]
MKKSMAQTGLSLTTKLGYAVGDFGANMVFQSVVLFLMFYLTDVFLIPAGVAGTIFLIAKIWDAVSDPMMGYISDRTKSRWGRKRPYLLFGALPLGICMALLFYTPALEGSSKTMYALVMFLLVCTAYTVVNIPYGALTANLTLDTNERSRLTGYRMFFAILGTLFVAGATKPLVGLFDSSVEGWRFIGMLYGAIAAFFTLVTFATVKERIQHKETEEYHLRDIVTTLKVNKPFIFLSIGVFLHLCAIGVLASMVNYLLKYNYAKEEFIPIAFLCMFATSAAVIPLWVFLSQKMGKKHAFNAGMGMLAVILLVLFFVKEFNGVLFIVLFVIAGISISTVFFSPWAMIPDTVEYSQWKTGIRREGILYGFFYFSQKLAAACAGFITGIGLTLCGYLQPLLVGNTLTSRMQAESALTGIRLLSTIIPMLLIILGIVFIWLFPIDEKMHRKIVEEIGSGVI